jgi:hypothetical protein
MVIKNITYTVDPDTGLPVAGSGKPLTREYFNRNGRTLVPGQATNVDSSISILDVLQNVTFLKDIVVVKDEAFVPSTWAEYHTDTIPVPNPATVMTEPNRIKLGDKAMAYDAATGFLKNPVSSTAMNPAAAQVAVFLSVAEKAYLTNLLAAAKDLYVSAASYKFTPRGGTAADAINIGLASASSWTFGQGGNMVLSDIGATWGITVTDGDSTRIYVGPAATSGSTLPHGSGTGTYTATLTKTVLDDGEVEPATTGYAYLLSDGTTSVHVDIANVPADTGDSTILQTGALAGAGTDSAFTLSKIGTDSFTIVGEGVTYVATSANSNFASILGTVNAVAALTLNPDAVSETIGAAVAIPTENRESSVSAPVSGMSVAAPAEVKASVKTVAKTAAAPAKPAAKKQKGLSLADLDAANKG